MRCWKSKFKWTNRKEFVERGAIQAYLDFKETEVWIEETDLKEFEELKPGVDIDGIVNVLLPEYAINLEDMTMRQTRMVKRCILDEMYEIARLYQHKAAKEWVIESLNSKSVL